VRLHIFLKYNKGLGSDTLKCIKGITRKLPGSIPGACIKDITHKLPGSIPGADILYIFFAKALQLYRIDYIIKNNVWLLALSITRRHGAREP
jgi:hypothetical protein